MVKKSKKTLEKKSSSAKQGFVFEPRKPNLQGVELKLTHAVPLSVAPPAPTVASQATSFSSTLSASNVASKTQASPSSSVSPASEAAPVFSASAPIFSTSALPSQLEVVPVVRTSHMASHTISTTSQLPFTSPFSAFVRSPFPPFAPQGFNTPPTVSQLLEITSAETQSSSFLHPHSPNLQVSLEELFPEKTSPSTSHANTSQAIQSSPLNTSTVFTASTTPPSTSNSFNIFSVLPLHLRDESIHAFRHSSSHLSALMQSSNSSSGNAFSNDLKSLSLLLQGLPADKNARDDLRSAITPEMHATLDILV